MAYTRLSMRKLRDILRLHFAASLSNRAIARAIGVSASTVSDCLARARAADVGWPLPEALSDTALDEALYGPRVMRQASAETALPDYAEVHRELRRKGVTLMLLWTEYKALHPDGLMYSAFSAIAPALLYLVSPASCSRTTPLLSYSPDSTNDPSRNYQAHATASSKP